MAVVNAGEWMEELLLKASIDPLPAPEAGPKCATGFLEQTLRGVFSPQQGHCRVQHRQTFLLIQYYETYRGTRIGIRIVSPDSC